MTATLTTSPLQAHIVRASLPVGEGQFSVGENGRLTGCRAYLEAILQAHDEACECIYVDTRFMVERCEEHAARRLVATWVLMDTESCGEADCGWCR